MRTRSRRPRQADIAKVAGVSQAAVSLVLNGQHSETVRIPDSTRERILDAARSLGYVANPLARSLAGGRSQLIGLYTFESMFPVDHHDFYYPFLIGIESAAEERGYDMVLFTSATGSDTTRSIYRGGVNRLQLADGCILLGKEMDRDVVAQLRDDEYPFVLVGRRDIPGGAVSYVTADYGEGTRAVVEHLHGLGHRRIAYLPAVTGSEPGADRDRGFKAAVEALALPTEGLLRPVDREAGPDPDDVGRLLDAGATAFLCHEAVVARRLIDQLTAHGVQVPTDVSVAALNDPPDAETGPVLTGFRIPRRDMGAHAVDLLIQQLESDEELEPRAVTLPCELVTGETSGVLRQEKQ